MIINIKKSYILTVFVVSAHGGALLLVAVVPVVLGLKLGLAALVGVSFWRQYRYGVWINACEVRFEEDGTCVQTANGRSRRYQVARATAHAGFVRMVLKRAGERANYLLVMSDAVEPEVYTDLRARIIQRRLPAPDRGLT